MRVRSLPCKVVPLPGETSTGYLGRLADANALDITSLVHHISRELRVKNLSVANPRFTLMTEVLGGLAQGHFARDRPRFLLYRRCHHAGWRLQRCAQCDVVDGARAACMVCSNGSPTQVFSRGGRYCVRHRRWHSDSEDELIVDVRDCVRAEQALSGRLWSRGVTMHTGEFDLAARLICDSWCEHPVAGQRVAGRLYVAIVDLLVTLTHPDVALTMAALAESQRRQVEGLIGLVVGAGRGSRTPELEDTAIRVIRVHRAAMYEALWMPKSNKATISRAPFEKAIAEASFRAKAVFLRHVTRSGRRDAFGSRAVRGAPSSRVVSRRIVPGWADNAPWNAVVIPAQSAAP